MKSADVVVGRTAGLQLNSAVICWTMCLNATSAMLLPVLNTIWDECEIGYSQVTELQGFFAIAVALGEVPGGIVADLFGFRRALIASQLLAFVAALIYCLAQDYQVFLLAEMFFALSFCLSSGCREAIIFESLKELGQENLYERVWGRIRSISFFVMAGSTVVSGAIAYLLGGRIILICLCVVFAANVPLQWLLVEPARTRPRFDVHQFVGVCRWCLFDKRLLAWWLLFAAFLTASNQMGLWLQQPYFIQHNGLSLQMIGVVFAVGHCIAAVGSSLAPRLNHIRLTLRLTLAILLVASGYLLMGGLVGGLSFGFFFLLQLARGFNGVLFSSEINKIAHKSARATTLSISNMLASVLYGVVSLGTGSFAASFGIPTLYVAVGIATMLGGLLFLLVKCNSVQEAVIGDLETAFDEAVGS